MGPIEVLYCWQSLLCALTAGGATQLVKTIVDIWWGHNAIPTVGVGVKMAAGRTLRQNTVVINRLILPMTPVLVGAIYAVVVPARPDPLTSYIAAHVHGWTSYLIYAAWGASCGQFSDYVVSKTKDLVAARVKRLGSMPPPPPADQPENQGGMGGG